MSEPRRGAAPRRRNGDALVASALALAGCADLMGLGGDYVAHESSAGAENVPDTVAGQSGGNTGTGTGGASGHTLSSGGSPSTGGQAGNDAGGGAAPLDSGNDVTHADPDTCRPGRFVGTFDGAHTPTITFVGVTLPVTGEMTVTFVAGGTGQLTIGAGSWEGTIGSSGLNQPFTARLVGTLDCVTGVLEADLVDGSFLSPPVGSFTGNLIGSFDPESESFSSTEWSSEELNADPDPTKPFGRGKGTWTLARVDP